MSRLQQHQTAPKDYVVLVPAQALCTFGFWKPKMEHFHAQLWAFLQEHGLRYFTDTTREVRVHPEDLPAARALVGCVEHEMKLRLQA